MTTRRDFIQTAAPAAAALLWHDRKGVFARGAHGTIPTDDPFAGHTFLPIDDRARNGKPQLVKSGSTFAAAYWTGDMWAYTVPDPSFVEQIDFEPTHYRAD